MNFKTTYFLFALLGVLCVVVGVVLYLNPSAAPGVGHLFPSMHNKGTEVETNSFTKIVIERKNPAGEDIVLEKGDDKNWHITSPRPMVADSGAVQSLLFNLHAAKLDPQAKVSNRKAAGLDAPSRIITLTAGDRTFKLTLGDSTLGDATALVYAESSDRKGQLLALRKPDVRSALEDLPYFRSKDLLGDTSDITGIKLSEGKKAPVELKKAGAGWTYIHPSYGEADVSNILTSLAGLSIHHAEGTASDFVADNVTDLAKYNLDPTKGDVLRIEVTRPGGSTTALIGVSKKEGEKYFAAIDEPKSKTKDIVKVSATSIEPFTKLLAEPGSLRNKNLVKLEGTPDAIDVAGHHGLLEFRRPDPVDWTVYRDNVAHKVDMTEMRLLIDAINQKNQVVSFPDASKRKELGLEKADKELIVVKIWADSLEKADPKKPGKPTFKKDAKPVAELRIGSRAGENVAVERIWGTDKTIVLVPKVLLDALDKRPVDFYDKNLPKFNPGSAEENVTKLEVTRDGQTIEMVRETPLAPWKLTKPAGLKGRFANEQVVRDILDTLNNRLRATEIVAEKADPKELPGYDLEKPLVKVIVTVTKDKTETKHEFDFGKERTAGKSIYAKVSGNPAVYAVDSSVLVALRREVRDMTALDFDADKVQSVTIKGWHALLGSTFSLTADKKDRTWTVKAPTGFMLGAEKLDRFLGSISKLQAEKFVPAGKDMTLEQGALQIEITLTDKKVLTLTVGGEEGESVFAQSSELKGETVLVRDLFKEARKAPAYFRK